MKLKGLTWMCNKCGTENDVLSKKCSKCGLHVDDNAILPSVKSAEYVSTYKTARTISQAVSFIGWVVVVLSVYLLIQMSLTGFPWGIFVYGGVLLSGILLVIAGQFTRATIDTADNTGQILALMKGKNNNKSDVQ